MDLAQAQASSYAVALGPLLLVIGLVVLFIAIALRYGGRLPRRISMRRPRPRHLVTRIVCGTLGAAILVAVAVGTWREVQRCYADEGAAAIRLRVPTKEAPSPILKEGEEVRLDAARLLVKLVIGESSGAGFRPVHADETEVRWPADSNRSFSKKFSVGEHRCEFQFQIQMLLRRGAQTDRRGGIAVWGSHYFHSRRWGSRQSSGGGLDSDRIHLLAELGDEEIHPLSIVRGRGQTLRAFCLVTLVAADDPLKEVTPAEFVKPREAEMIQSVSERAANRYRARYPDAGDMPMRGVALAGQIGVASLLLFVAAVLLAQLFARRNLAFAGVLAAVVLYVALLDRAALGAHLARLADKQTPIPARLVACRQSAETFFYRGTAARALESVTKDAAAPKGLREAAGAAAAELQAKP